MKCYLIFMAMLIPLVVCAGPADDAWDAWLVGDFDRVVTIAGRSGTDANLADSERSRIYFTLGCTEAMRGKDGFATVAFQKALDLNPALIVTQDELPPPVWRVFASIRERQAVTTGKSQTPLKEIAARVDTIRIPVAVTRSKAAAVRSLIAPGWGHITEGKQRGYWIAGSEAILTAGWIASAIASSSARSDYLKARSSSDISNKYKTYNTYYQLSWGFGLSALALYIGTQYDFFTSMPSIEIGVIQRDDESMLSLGFRL